MNKKSNEKNYAAEAVWNFCESLLKLTWAGIPGLFNRIVNAPISALAWYGSSYVAIYLVTAYKLHLKFMAWIWPSLFSGKVLKWFLSVDPSNERTFFVVGALWIYVIVLGAIKLAEDRRLKQKFEAIGLTNRFGQTPRLFYMRQLDEHRELWGLNAKSISEEQFQAKKSALEAAFGRRIESIKSGEDLRNIEIIFTTKRMPTMVRFNSLVHTYPLSEGHFYLGESSTGVERANLESLPHMLIAGTTGGGKSVFFKQAILGLLSSTSRLQVYFIDLKRGLEAKDFKAAPNVAIAKDPSEALSILEKVHAEMERRFKFLENRGLKAIEPERDDLDRIVVAVDEAAELYADKSKFDPDYESTINAQKLTNSIARLGRAAGIHLILSTQKVTKESINTIIQETVSMRVCFKLNTLQGSLQVLGNKDALDLPSIPGRGIYQLGSEQKEIQAPFVSDLDVKNICLKVEDDYATGRKCLSQKMIGTSPTANGNAQDEKATRTNLLDIDV